MLDLKPPSCKVQDKFTCWQKEGSKKYASAARLNEDYKDFCDRVEPKDTKGWSYKHTYHKGTPDETEFSIALSGTSTSFDKADCKKKMWAVINNCDGNDPKNPMNWKFGGEFVHGDYTYEVTPKKAKRHWPVPKEPGGSCKGTYMGGCGDYVIKGYGWASSDSGQDTLRPKAKSCVGGGLTSWEFHYFDEPDADGNEWNATFNTPIWVRRRCFNNNKVQFAAGGFTNGCKGSD